MTRQLVINSAIILYELLLRNDSGFRGVLDSRFLFLYGVQATVICYFYSNSVDFK